MVAPDQQLSQTNIEARAMAPTGRGKAIVVYNVQAAVDTTHHLIVAHEMPDLSLIIICWISDGLQIFA